MMRTYEDAEQEVRERFWIWNGRSDSSYTWAFISGWFSGIMTRDAVVGSEAYEYLRMLADVAGERANMAIKKEAGIFT